MGNWGGGCGISRIFHHPATRDHDFQGSTILTLAGCKLEPCWLIQAPLPVRGTAWWAMVAARSGSGSGGGDGTGNSSSSDHRWRMPRMIDRQIDGDWRLSIDSIVMGTVQNMASWNGCHHGQGRLGENGNTLGGMPGPASAAPDTRPFQSFRLTLCHVPVVLVVVGQTCLTPLRRSMATTNKYFKRAARTRALSMESAPLFHMRCLRRLHVLHTVAFYF